MKHISRKEWGAQPPPKGKFDKLNRARVAGVVIHHSGVQNGPKGSDAVKAFERHHMGKGWDGIGYNWLVDESGTIFEGRGWDNRGAGTKGWNSRSISVCFTGWGFNKPSDNALRSLQTVVDAAEYHFGKGLWVSTHRKKAKEGYTTCPGDWLGNWVESGMGVVEAPETVDWGAIIQFFKDLHEQVKKTPLSRPSRSRGLPVRLVQGKLVERGFDPGPVDGIFGKKTGDAIRAFQETQGFLKVTGVVNGETFGCLFIQ
jgi:hypothetical protein